MSEKDKETPARIRTLIVDDEPLARSSLALLLRLDPDIEILGECGSGVEALEQLRNSKPDLIFLDVQMPECDGFDVLEKLGTNLPPAIVFVTAYDQYAVRAFEAGALDYLLKPFDDVRLARALERAKKRIAHDGNQSQSSHPATERWAIKNAGSISFVNISEIDWIEAADYYACLHVASKTHLLRRSMSELERELPAPSFCRIHRSAIVNLGRVQGMKLSSAGEYEVLLRDGTRLPLSRRYRKQLQSRLSVRASGT